MRYNPELIELPDQSINTEPSFQSVSSQEQIKRGANRLRNFVLSMKRKHVVQNSPRINYLLAVHWEWLPKDEVKPLSYWTRCINRCWFLYRGIICNESLRASALIIASLTDVNKDRIMVLRNDYKRVEHFNLDEEEKRLRLESLDRKSMRILMSLDSLLNSAFRCETSKGYLRVGELMRMADAPYDTMCQAYIRNRDYVLTVEDEVARRYEMLLLLGRTVAYMKTLTDYTRSAIDRNDELVFRILVLCLNVVILITNFVYDREWKLQIKSLYDVVVCNLVQECSAS